MMKWVTKGKNNLDELEGYIAEVKILLKKIEEFKVVCTLNSSNGQQDCEAEVEIVCEKGQ